jgi:hypothetical protein
MRMVIPFFGLKAKNVYPRNPVNVWFSCGRSVMPMRLPAKEMAPAREDKVRAFVRETIGTRSTNAR